MSYFKKFADFCSGFACFTALIYLFRQYMVFEPDTEEAVGMLEKLKLFVSKTEKYDNRLLLTLALLFALSVLAGRIFSRRLCFVPVIAALVPLLLAVDMIEAERIREYPMMYVFFGGLAVVAGMYECVRMDRADGKRRAAWARSLTCASVALFCFGIYKRADEVLRLSFTGGLEPWEREFILAGEMDIKLFATVGAVYLVLLVIGLLLTDIYFIDAALAVVPAVWLIYLWNAQKLTAHAHLFVTLGVAYAAVCTIAAFSGRARLKIKVQERNQL